MSGKIWVAIGNPLRGDDGAARRVVELAAPGPDVTVLEVIQLTPELATVIAQAELVVFLDASAGAGEVTLTEIEPGETRAGWSHQLDPASLTAMARALYGFSGRARLCALPAIDFTPGQHLSERAEASATEAAALMRRGSAQ